MQHGFQSQAPAVANLAEVGQHVAHVVWFDQCTAVSIAWPAAEGDCELDSFTAEPATPDAFPASSSFAELRSLIFSHRDDQFAVERLTVSPVFRRQQGILCSSQTQSRMVSR